MKSGPALAAATLTPRPRRWRNRPAVTKVLPLPEAGAAMISPTPRRDGRGGSPTCLSRRGSRVTIIREDHKSLSMRADTMRTSFGVADMTIHRIVEQEAGFTPILEFLPSLSQGLLDENRSWMEPAALDPAGMAVLCFQSYVVKTPHHTILVDACIGNDKSFPHRLTWHRKHDSNWMQALKAAGLSVADIDFVICTATMSAGTRGSKTAAGCRPSRTPNISFRKRNTNIGTACTGRRHWIR